MENHCWPCRPLNGLLRPYKKQVSKFMTDLDFLKGCGIAPDSPDAEPALKLRSVLAQLSKFKPEELTPDMTCGELYNSFQPKPWWEDGPDALEVILAVEEALERDIPNKVTENMMAPWLYPEATIRELISNWMDILAKHDAGESFPPRYLTFWTDKRWYRWAAWGLPILSMAALAASLIGLRLVYDEELIYRLVLIVIAPMTFWLGVRLWKCHRVTLDRLRFEHKYRVVLHTLGQNSVLLEHHDFSSYDGWSFADAATAAKRTNEIAVFLNLPLETPQGPLLKMNISFFRGWNPVDWDVIDTMPFFLELSSFCEKCKKAGFSADVNALLNTIRGLSSFSSLAAAVVKFEARLPQDVLPVERKTLLEAMERTSVRVIAYFKFLQDCEVQSGTIGAYLASKLRKLWALGNHRLTENEVSADMTLGELAPQWFPPGDNDWDLHEEKVLAWGIALGKYYDILSDLNPQPEWTLGELVRKCKNRASHEK